MFKKFKKSLVQEKNISLLKIIKIQNEELILKKMLFFYRLALSKISLGLSFPIAMNKITVHAANKMVESFNRIIFLRF